MTVAGRHVPLAPQEYQILLLLVGRRGQVVSTSDVRDHLYGQAYAAQLGIIDVLMSHLRKILTAASPNRTRYIETVWGEGYKLTDADPLPKDSDDAC